MCTFEMVAHFSKITLVILYIAATQDIDVIHVVLLLALLAMMVKPWIMQRTFLWLMIYLAI